MDYPSNLHIDNSLNRSYLNLSNFQLYNSTTGSNFFPNLLVDPLNQIPPYQIDLGINLSNFSESQYFVIKNQLLALKYLSRDFELSKLLNKYARFPTIEDSENYKLNIQMTHKNVNSIYKFLRSKDQNELLLYSPQEKEYLSSQLEFLDYEEKRIKDNLKSVISTFKKKKEYKGRLSEINKFIKLQKMQNEINNQVLEQKEEDMNRIFPHTMESQLVNRKSYIVNREQCSLQTNYGIILENCAQNIKSFRAVKKNGIHKKLLEAIESYSKDFSDQEKRKLKILKKLSYDAKAQIEYFKNKDQIEKEKLEKERIKLLKSNEFDKYLTMLKESKNKRILEILSQTHKYFVELGSKVLIQKTSSETLRLKKEIQNINGDDEETNIEKTFEINAEEISPEQVQMNFTRSKDIYYHLTHTINEETNYDSKILIGGKLKSYQESGVKWLISLYNNNLNGILADEMGLGKTIQAIALFCYLIERKNNDGPFMIVVPLGTLLNWKLEFEKWAPSVKVIIYKGDPESRKIIISQLRMEKFNVLLTTYEYVMKDKSTLNKIIWQYIVIDEGHRMKNSKCKFALILMNSYKCLHRLLLTGTPLQNNLTELWALLNFLLPKVFASSEDFEKWFNQPFSKNSDKNYALDEEEKLLIIYRLHQVLSPFLLRRVKSEVEHELPGKYEFVLKVELSSWQKMLYTQIQETGTLNRDPSTGKIGCKYLMNCIMQLRKVCNHPYLFLDNIDSDFLLNNISRCSGKFELLDRMLPKLIKTNHKMLIFSQMTSLLNFLEIFLFKKGIVYLRLDGSTKAEERGESTKIFNDFNSIYKVFLLSTRAGGQGLNLQGADTVILFDSDFNPQIDLQAQDRAHRIGQIREVRVFRLITMSKVEEGILANANQKKNIDEAVIQAGLFHQNANDMDRRKRIEELLKKEKNQFEISSGEILSDTRINEMLARNEEEFETFEKFDRERYAEENKDRILQEIMTKLGQKALSENYNYRLIQEYEVPDFIKAIPNPKENNNPEIISGKRKRKEISYDEALYENELKLLLDEDEEESHLRKNRKKKKIQNSSIMSEDKISNSPKEEEVSDNAKSLPSPSNFISTDRLNNLENIQISTKELQFQDESNLQICEIKDIEEVRDNNNI